MSDVREQHVQAVALAVQEVEAFQTLLNVAQEKGENAIGAIYQAIGQQPTVDSARNALEHTAAARERLPELVGLLEVAADALRLYGQGV